MYAAGALTKFYTDTFFDEVVKVNPKKVPVDNTTSKFAGTYCDVVQLNMYSSASSTTYSYV